MEGQPKVSVIIPVYNVECYLRECLDSLIHQTMQDMEIICVDDGSTDHSLEILKEYAARDERITVIQQENRHAGAARNLGLENAKGEYVIFLDADDCFQLSMLQKTYEKATETEADIVLFDAQKFDSQTGIRCTETNYLKQSFLPAKQVFSCRDIPDNIFQVTTPCPWNKLFRRAFIDEHALRFQSLTNSNDVYFVYLAMCLAERIAVVNAPFVYYRVNTGTSLQDRKAKNPCCFVEAYKALYDSLYAAGKWEMVKRSYANAVVSSAVFNLESIADPEARYRVEEALNATEFRKTGYLSLGMQVYDYPEKYFKLRCALTAYMTLRQNSICTLSEQNNSEQKLLVSVIIPIYNTEQWLEESINSIRNQTLKEIEIICVNDGSTDGSPEILDRLAACDSRIRIITQPNGGLSTARNAGLKQARGEYVYFFDSDDLLKENALEYLYHEAQQNDLDVLLFDAETLFETEKLVQSNKEFDRYYLRDKAYDDILTGENMYTTLRNADMYRCSVCIQFVKRLYLEETGITFLNGIIHEDELYTVQLLLKANRVSHRNVPLFIRRVRENSIMTAPVTFMSCYAYFRIVVELLKWLGEEENVLEKNTETVLEKRIKHQVQNTRNSWNSLEWKQKRCVQAMPISERIIFEMWMEQHVEGLVKQLMPKWMKSVVKKLMRYVPRPIKVAIKRIIRW